MQIHKGSALSSQKTWREENACPYGHSSLFLFQLISQQIVSKKIVEGNVPALSHEWYIYLMTIEALRERSPVWRVG